jgi:hypothetical protein
VLDKVIAVGETRSMAKTKEYTSLKNTHDAHGRKVALVHDAGHSWKSFKSNTRVPDTLKLLNFDLVFGSKRSYKDGHRVTRSRTILCLDNYGNEIMCSKAFKNLFNGCDIFDFLLGIDRESGEILRVSFLQTDWKNDLVAAYCPLVMGLNKGLFVPQEYRGRLDELKNKKRPWFVTLSDRALFHFIERFYGYRDLEGEILVDLEFDGSRAQVGQDMWREVSNWK